MNYMRQPPEPDSRCGKKVRSVKNRGGGPVGEAADRRYARNRQTGQVMGKETEVDERR